MSVTGIPEEHVEFRSSHMRANSAGVCGDQHNFAGPAIWSLVSQSCKGLKEGSLTPTEQRCNRTLCRSTSDRDMQEIILLLTPIGRSAERRAATAPSGAHVITVDRC
ncbi:hypothetical protein EYF80_039545 [Liparis tanakae]|uniref:Uncharacterized protein n=1 Tax=Liparis tanakae TaxID=230148 RepID=A0A4Z2GAL3_9TELE|nr:hypothetical protein EYF80_039545 [Liparis tanakae]